MEEWLRTGTRDLNAASTPAVVPGGTINAGSTLANCSTGDDDVNFWFPLPSKNGTKWNAVLALEIVTDNPFEAIAWSSDAVSQMAMKADRAVHVSETDTFVCSDIIFSPCCVYPQYFHGFTHRLRQCRLSTSLTLAHRGLGCRGFGRVG